MPTHKVAGSRDARDADEREIRAIHQRMIAAWNAGDGGAFAASFSSDADFIAFEGTHLVGREAIAVFHREIFATAVKGSRLWGEVKFVRFLDAVSALMHSSVEVTMAGDAAPTPSRRSMQLMLLSLRDGAWRAVALMNARRLTLERQFFLDDLDALPERVRDRLIDLAASYRKELR